MAWNCSTSLGQTSLRYCNFFKILLFFFLSEVAKAVKDFGIFFVTISWQTELEKKFQSTSVIKARVIFYLYKNQKKSYSEVELKDTLSVYKWRCREAVVSGPAAVPTHTSQQGLRNGTWTGGVQSRGVNIWIFLTKMASKNSGKSEGAKRGRTEPTGSPPERSPTPGEARLGDWMRKIEETITAQWIFLPVLWKKSTLTPAGYEPAT